MQKLQDIIKKLAVVSGIPDAEITSALEKVGNTPLNSIELDDAVANKMSGGLFSEDAAKNNPAILSHAKAQVLNAVDTEITRLEQEYGLTDEQKARIKNCSTSFKKIAEVTKIAQEIVEAKHANSGKSEKELAKQIDTLNAEKAELIRLHTEKLAEKDQAIKDQKLNWELDGIYNGRDYALENVPKEIAIMTAKNTVAEALRKNGAVIKLSDDGIPVVVRTEGGTKYFDGNTDLSSPKDYITRHLTEAKLLKVSNGKKPNNTSTGNGNGKPIKGLEELDKALEASLVSLPEE